MDRSFSNFKFEIGCDEAGRGCLAGPVFAAAVIIDKHFSNDFINDSKLLSEKKRNELKIFIENNSLHWAVGIAYPEEIDEINILNASFLAMHRAIDQLNCSKELIIVDGNRFKSYNGINHHCIVKGDSKYMNIASASILAKTYRDEYMEKIHHEFPMYNWKKNKGYPTREHKMAIKEYGLTDYHRKSFKLFETQLSLNI